VQSLSLPGPEMDTSRTHGRAQNGKDQNAPLIPQCPPLNCTSTKTPNLPNRKPQIQLTKYSKLQCFLLSFVNLEPMPTCSIGYHKIPPNMHLATPDFWYGFLHISFHLPSSFGAGLFEHGSDPEVRIWTSTNSGKSNSSYLMTIPRHGSS